MHFQSGDTVYDFDAGSLHHFGGGEVVFFVKTGLQFYEYGDFLTVLGSGYQGVDDNGVFGYAVLRHHDFAGFRVVHGFVEEVDEMLERVVGVVKQQVLLGDVVEDGFLFVEEGELHRFRLFHTVQGFIRVGEMAQVFQIEVLVAWDELVTLDAEGVYEEVPKVLWHGAVVDKTAYVAYLAFLHFPFQLGYEVGAAGGVVNQNVGIAGDFDAVARVDVVAGEDEIEVRLDDVFGEHQIVVLFVRRKLDEAGHFGIGLLHDEVIGGVRLGVFQIDTDSKIKPVVSQEGDDSILRHRYGLEIRKDFLFEKVFDELLMERLYMAVLIKYDVALAQGRQYFLFVDAHTVIQLPVDFPVDFLYKFAGGLYGFFVTFRSSRGDSFMVGYTDFVKLFEVGRVDRDEVDTFVKRQTLVQSLQQYAVIE